MHENSLRAFPFIETTRRAYGIAADLLAKYPRLGPGDAIIGATAIDGGCPLLTLDRDLEMNHKNKKSCGLIQRNPLMKEVGITM